MYKIAIKLYNSFYDTFIRDIWMESTARSYLRSPNIYTSFGYWYCVKEKCTYHYQTNIARNKQQMTLMFDVIDAHYAYCKTLMVELYGIARLVDPNTKKDTCNCQQHVIDDEDVEGGKVRFIRNLDTESLVIEVFNRRKPDRRIHPSDGNLNAILYYKKMFERALEKKQNKVIL
jgi:hypothetical protein